MYKGIEGNKYGMLTAIRNTHKHYRNTKALLWEFRCDCGTIKELPVAIVARGDIRSCGCYQKSHPTNITHGESNSRLYNLWCAMKNRCYNKKMRMYYNYGGRGITVCDEWRNSYEAFRDWAYANGYNDTLTLDRIDNNSGYSPENCKWSTQKEQNRNKRNNVLLTYNGETKTAQEWSEIVGIKAHTIFARIHDYGYTDEEALTLPVTNPPTLPKRGDGQLRNKS